MLERAHGGRRMRWQREIVLDVPNAGYSTDFHARIQDPVGIVSPLDGGELVKTLSRRGLEEQWSTETPVPVLARERSAEGGHQRRDFLEQGFDARTPVRLAHVDERVRMHVRVSRVPEDHAANAASLVRLAQTGHVVAEPRRR